jgi:hypothetical protein
MTTKAFNKIRAGLEEAILVAPYVARIAALEMALQHLIRVHETWNAAVETIIGRPPNWDDGYLDEARAVLAAQALITPESN